MKTPNCQVCNESAFKYKCPKCLIKYCSLLCYKKHKEENCPKQDEYMNISSSLSEINSDINNKSLSPANKDTQKISTNNLNINSDLDNVTTEIVKPKILSNSIDLLKSSISPKSEPLVLQPKNNDFTNSGNESFNIVDSSFSKLVDYYISDEDTENLNDPQLSKNNLEPMDIVHADEKTHLNLFKTDEKEMTNFQTNVSHHLNEAIQLTVKPKTSTLVNNSSNILDSDLISPDVLSRLQYSDEILKIVKDKELQNILRHIDKSTDPGAEIAQFMKSPIFAEFSTECLKVIEY